MEPGYAFPLGPKDAILAGVEKLKNNPGPGEHNLPPQMKVQHGMIKTMGKP